MKATGLLQQQLSNLNTIFHSVVEDLTDQEWTARPAPGQNMIAFTVWHMLRVQDNHIRLWFRNLPEIAHGERWVHWHHLKRFGTGTGIASSEADEIAVFVRRAEVLEYADAVLQEALTWLQELADDDLDKIPDARSHLAPYPEYQTSPYHEETVDLLDQPIWSQLMRPCIGHIHRHLGELEVVKQLIRQSG
jgi:hypothetical protein